MYSRYILYPKALIRVTAQTRVSDTKAAWREQQRSAWGLCTADKHVIFEALSE